MTRHVEVDGAMSDAAKDEVRRGVTTLAVAVSNTAHAHGWWDDDAAADPLILPLKIALMHSELSEALEAWRNDTGHNMRAVKYEYPVTVASGIKSKTVLYAPRFVYADGTVELGKPVGVASELADTIIRILDTCATLDIPIAEALINKAEYNRSRPWRHGGKLA
jgi:hypothetical protein